MSGVADNSELLSQIGAIISTGFVASFYPNFKIESSHPRIPYVPSETSLLVSFEVDSEHCNYLDNLHGGAAITLLETVTAFALLRLRPNKYSVAMDISMNYLRAVPKGEKVFVLAKVKRVGGQLAFLGAELYNDQGELCYEGIYVKMFTGESIKL